MRRRPAALAVLDAALTWTHGVLQHARTADPAAPTPCRGWCLRDLLEHLDDSLAALGEAADGHVAPAPPYAGDQPVPVPVLVDRVSRRARGVRAGWAARVTSAPVRLDDLGLDRDDLALVGAVEVVVHGWDVARAVGCDWTVPADLATRLLPVALGSVAEGERARRFGPAVPLSPGAPAAALLLAHLGRDPQWVAPHPSHESLVNQ